MAPTSPFITNEMKHQKEQIKKPIKDTLINLQIYQPPQPKAKEPVKQFIPMPGYFGQPPIEIIKKYNINIDGPTGDHGRAKFIFEDVIPTKHIDINMSTVAQRINMHNFTRSNLIKHKDGEDINLKSGRESILNSMKFMDLNPYYVHRISSNPYKGLPDGMLLYRTCYPIRYNDQRANVLCAENSVGFNVRIYGLLNEEYEIKNDPKRSFNFDVWREVYYYEFIREKIIKNKVCPNFVMMNAYYISIDCGINFRGVAEAQERSTTKYIQTSEEKEKPKIRVIGLHYVDLEPRSGIQMYNPPPIEPRELNPKDYSGNSLVVLTEASTHSLFHWLSVKYTDDGNINKMVNSGFYGENIWFSVLFQLMAAVYTLYKYGIVINDLSIEHNVFIRDLKMEGPATNYWKYIIDGIEYYVPNYGYVVLIDTSFKDVDLTLEEQAHGVQRYKIWGDKEPFHDKKDPKKSCIDNIKKAFTVSEYKRIREGYLNLPQSVEYLLNDIIISLSRDDYDISYMFVDHMKMYMNNRVGTFLQENEIKYIRLDENRKIRRGDIVTYRVKPDLHKFVIYVEDNGDLTCKIIDKDEGNIIVRDKISSNEIFPFPKNVPIEQNFVQGLNLSIEGLLETYNL